VLDNFTSPAADLDQQIAIMGGWLARRAMGKSTGEPPPGVRPGPLRGASVRCTCARQVAKEILANLQHVEQVLDRLRPATLQSARRCPSCNPIFARCTARWSCSTIESRRRSALDLRALNHGLPARKAQALTDDMDWIAEGLSSLGFLPRALPPRARSGAGGDRFSSSAATRGATRPPSLDTTMRMKSPDAVGAAAVEARDRSSTRRRRAAREAPTPARAWTPTCSPSSSRKRRGAETIDKTVPECRARPTTAKR
jgi:hypothetical protein